MYTLKEYPRLLRSIFVQCKKYLQKFSLLYKLQIKKIEERR